MLPHPLLSCYLLFHPHHVRAAADCTGARVAAGVWGWKFQLLPLPSLSFAASDTGSNGESDLWVKHDIHWLVVCNVTCGTVWPSRLESVCLNYGQLLKTEKDARNETPQALLVVLSGLKHLETSWICWLKLHHSLSYVTSMNILHVATVILTLSNVSSLSRAVQISSELSYCLC